MDDKEVNERQEKFCQLYATEKEFFGNGVETYLEVYDIDRTKPNWYKTACAAASRLLANVKVCERINEILEEQGLNDSFVDKQLKFLLTQHADFGSKMNAIKEYNKLKSRITEKFDHTVHPIPILGRPNVPTNNSNAEIAGNDQADTSSTGGDIGKQDSVDRVNTDEPGTIGQGTDANLNSFGILATLEKGSDEGLSADNAATQVLQGQSLE